MKIQILVSLLVILACVMTPSQVSPAAALGNVIYVSTAGSNSTGDGSISNPFQTIGHAITTATAGDEIVLRGSPAVADNRYEESIRIEIPNITVRSQDGEWAVIECPINNESITECIRLDVDSSGSKIRNLEVIGGYYYGIKLETRWDWGDPSNRGGASNILIEGVVIHNTGRDAIKITPGCDDVTIRRVEIYNTGVRDNSNAEGIDNVNGDRMIVQDSYLHDIATTGIYFKGGAMDGIVERNRIERTGEAGILIGFDTSPEYFDLTVNPSYYENIRGIVRNNIISDTPYSGIGLYAAQNAQILNNTIINTAQVGHSPIYFGITYQDWDPAARRPSSVNPIIQNNLISQPAGQVSECIFIRYSEDLGGLSALSGMPTMDYNVLYRAGSDCLFTDRRPGSTLEAGTFSQWQAHITGDTHSITNDPQVQTDGSLLSASPAIDNGNNVNCPVTDQRGAGRPHDGNGDSTATCDIGAYEFGAPTNTTFTDVPLTHPLYKYIEALYDAGYTAGCSSSPMMFCPDTILDRAQSAVFMLRGQMGSGYTPPSVTGIFGDNWTGFEWAQGWAEGMYAEGLTTGCQSSPLLFCPANQLPRVEASIFGLRMKYGVAYVPPAASGTLFADFPPSDPSYWGIDWAEQAYNDGLLPACGTDSGTGKPMFCPSELVNRGWGAYLIVKAKNLPTP